MVSRSEIEAALWKWSGWKADQRVVDELLSLIDQYAGQPAPQACHVPDWRGKPVAVDSDCTHVGPAQLRPWTYDDLPEDERKRLLTLRQADMALAFKRGQEAASKAEPERPAERLSGGTETDVVVEGYRDAEGGLWVRLGAVQEEAERVATLWKSCSQCKKRKPLARFRHDRSSKAKHRGALRAQCKDCEREQRRIRVANKVKGT